MWDNLLVFGGPLSVSTIGRTISFKVCTPIPDCSHIGGLKENVLVLEACLQFLIQEPEIVWRRKLVFLRFAQFLKVLRSGLTISGGHCLI